MMWAKSFGLCLFALGSNVSAGIINERSSDSSFSLYAYGENIGGLPLYYADGELRRIKFRAIYSHHQHRKRSDFQPHTGQRNRCWPGFMYARTQTQPLESHTHILAVTPGSSGPLVGNPANETSSGDKSSSASFSNQQLFIPSANSTDHGVGFTTSPSSDEVTTKFVWYGHFLLVETEDGEYTSLFYAKKNQTQEGAYSLQWNITDDDDSEYYSVSMRSIAPSNA
jgi:hypothetical protein